MDLSNLRQDYINTTKLYLYTSEQLKMHYDGVEVEVDDNTPYIVVSEMDSIELKGLTSDGQANLTLLRQILPKKIKEHNIYDGDKLAKVEQVSAVITDSASLFSYVAEKIIDAMTLKKTTEPKSGELQENSSMERK